MDDDSDSEADAYLNKQSLSQEKSMVMCRAAYSYAFCSVLRGVTVLCNI